MDNREARRLVFDIETVALPDAGEYLEPVDAPANYKDPVKIAAFIAEGTQQALLKAGLDVDLCRIVAVGWALEGDEPAAVTIEQFNGNEALMLKSFWMLLQDHHLVGFNCLGFDLPVLLRRSLYLGVHAPNIQIDRFKHPRVTDLMDELSYGGKLKFRGLAFYCKRFGIDVPDTLTGADVAAAVASGDWAEVEAHVRADVRKTSLLAARMGLVRDVLVV
jgi:predicted PolB exonuclease-like 3'-5' exonuclease